MSAALSKSSGTGIKRSGIRLSFGLSEFFSPASNSCTHGQLQTRNARRDLGRSCYGWHCCEDRPGWPTGIYTSRSRLTAVATAGHGGKTADRQSSTATPPPDRQFARRPLLPTASQPIQSSIGAADRAAGPE
jgi:hypothetical protein